MLDYDRNVNVKKFNKIDRLEDLFSLLFPYPLNVDGTFPQNGIPLFLYDSILLRSILNYYVIYFFIIYILINDTLIIDFLAWRRCNFCSGITRDWIYLIIGCSIMSPFFFWEWYEPINYIYHYNSCGRGILEEN